MKNQLVDKIGFGTWKLPNDETIIPILKDAIDVGYRHFDTAYSYQNEEAVGMAFSKLIKNREDFFITGKLWNDDRGYDNIINACKRTINNLKCEYLDEYLVHYPASMALYDNWEEINNETWRAMEYLKKEGLVKHIGVSNFKKHHLEALIKNATIMPYVNQIEFHPGLTQKETVDFCKENNIIVEAWSPLGSGKMLKRDVLKDLASKYNTTAAQLCLKWCLQNYVIPLPKSLNIEEMKMNLDLDNFTISDEDMKFMNELPYMGGSGIDSDTITIFK